MINKKNILLQQGLTLVELLVGIVVGLVVLSAAGGAMISYIKSYNDSQKILNLNQNMRGVMDIMAREIRRAGYMSSDIAAMKNPASSPKIFKSNPFFEGDYDLGIYNDGQCIVFSYEKDEFAGASLGDKAGFKLGSNKDVQMRKSATENKVNCSWSGAQELEGITDNDIIVDRLKFTINGSEGINIDNPAETCVSDPNTKNCLYVRSVRIELTASLKEDSNIKQTLVQTVKIRNDKFKPKN